MGTVFQRDYSSLLTCTAMAWTAANLLLVLAAWMLPPAIFGVAAGLAYLYFLVLMFFAVRTVFGTGNGSAAAASIAGTTVTAPNSHPGRCPDDRPGRGSDA